MPFVPEEAEKARILRTLYERAPAEAAPLIKEELCRFLFFHCIELVPGIVTPGLEWTRGFTELFARIAPKLPLQGKRVLDIGCRDGAQALCIEAAGASEVWAIDNDLSPGLVNFVIPFTGSKIECLELNLYQLNQAALGIFDVINFCGVLYHLQFPLWGLKQIRDALRPGGLLIIETGVLTGLGELPLIAYLPGDLSPYEGTSPTFFNVAGLQAALRMLGFQDFVVHDLRPQKPYDIARRFPEFFALCKAELAEARLFMTCTFSPESIDSFTAPYFEGLHRIHSDGRDRRKS